VQAEMSGKYARPTDLPVESGDRHVSLRSLEPVPRFRRPHLRAQICQAGRNSSEENKKFYIPARPGVTTPSNRPTTAFARGNRVIELSIGGDSMRPRDLVSCPTSNDGWHSLLANCVDRHMEATRLGEQAVAPPKSRGTEHWTLFDNRICEGKQRTALSRPACLRSR